MPDLNRFKRAMDRAGTRPECPICGGSVWSPGTSLVLLQAIKDDLDMDVGSGYLAYQLRCDSCGFYRLHSVDLVHELTSDEGKGEEGSPNDQNAG
jgi:hypothetical protein